MCAVLLDNSVPSVKDRIMDFMSVTSYVPERLSLLSIHKLFHFAHVLQRFGTFVLVLSQFSIGHLCTWSRQQI
jgi:hypothetical protein